MKMLVVDDRLTSLLSTKRLLGIIIGIEEALMNITVKDMMVEEVLESV
jgi:hypothetical protein